MKTNQILTRKMGAFDVLQRTDDGMFNATTLMKQWNASSGMKKEVTKYFENPSTVEFVNTIIKRECNSLIINDTQKTDNAKSTKHAYIKQRGGINGGGCTWMHPLLFIDFAMWINPEFKYDVLKFVYDELVKFRNDAGDAYIEMSSAVAKIAPKKEIPQSISKVAQAINYITFGYHGKEARNKADERGMKELVELEKNITMLIENGFINSYDNLLKHLRRLYEKKYFPKLLQA